MKKNNLSGGAPKRTRAARALPALPNMENEILKEITSLNRQRDQARGRFDREATKIRRQAEKDLLRNDRQFVRSNEKIRWRIAILEGRVL